MSDIIIGSAPAPYRDYLNIGDKAGNGNKIIDSAKEAKEAAQAYCAAELKECPAFVEYVLEQGNRSWQLGEMVEAHRKVSIAIEALGDPDELVRKQAMAVLEYVAGPDFHYNYGLTDKMVNLLIEALRDINEDRQRSAVPVLVKLLDLPISSLTKSKIADALVETLDNNDLKEIIIETLTNLLRSNPSFELEDAVLNAFFNVLAYGETDDEHYPYHEYEKNQDLYEQIRGTVADFLVSLAQTDISDGLRDKILGLFEEKCSQAKAEARPHCRRALFSLIYSPKVSVAWEVKLLKTLVPLCAGDELKDVYKRVVDLGRSDLPLELKVELLPYFIDALDSRWTAEATECLVAVGEQMDTADFMKELVLPLIKGFGSSERVDAINMALTALIKSEKISRLKKNALIDALVETLKEKKPDPSSSPLWRIEETVNIFRGTIGALVKIADLEIDPALREKAENTLIAALEHEEAEVKRGAAEFAIRKLADKKIDGNLKAKITNSLANLLKDYNFVVWALENLTASFVLLPSELRNQAAKTVIKRWEAKKVVELSYDTFVAIMELIKTDMTQDLKAELILVLLRDISFKGDSEFTSYREVELVDVVLELLKPIELAPFFRTQLAGLIIELVLSCYKCPQRPLFDYLVALLNSDILPSEKDQIFASFIDSLDVINDEELYYFRADMKKQRSWRASQALLVLAASDIPEAVKARMFELLFEALVSENNKVREGAARLLEKIPADEFMPAAQRALNQEPAVQAEAFGMLVSLLGADIPFASKIYIADVLDRFLQKNPQFVSRREDLAQRLAELTPAVIDAGSQVKWGKILIRQIGCVKVQQKIAENIVKIAESNISFEEQSNMIDLLLELLERGSDDEKQGAARALASLVLSRIVPGLKIKIMDSTVELAKKGNKQARIVLDGVLKSDLSPERKEKALAFIFEEDEGTRKGDQPSAQKLISVAGSDLSAEAQDQIALKLVEFVSEKETLVLQVVECLVAMLGKQVLSRETRIKMVGPFLKLLTMKDLSEDLRIEVVIALKYLLNSDIPEELKTKIHQEGGIK